MNQISFVGNLTADPAMRATGKSARATFSVAVNEGSGDDERTHFVNCTAWGTLADNVASSLNKGNRVVVVGRINTYSKGVTIDGEEKNLTIMSVTASAVGPDLRWAVARVAKVARATEQPADEAGDEPVDEAPATNGKSNGKVAASVGAADDEF